MNTPPRINHRQDLTRCPDCGEADHLFVPTTALAECGFVYLVVGLGHFNQDGPIEEGTEVDCCNCGWTGPVEDLPCDGMADYGD